MTEESVQQFFDDLMQAIRDKVDVDAFLARLRKSSTHSKLRELAPELIAAMRADGKSLSEAVRESKAFARATEHVNDLGAQANAFAGEAAACLKTMDDELAKRGINWKIAAAGLAGVLLGVAAKSRR